MGAKYEGDPRSNANTSVISSTFGISINGFHVYYDIIIINSLRYDYFFDILHDNSCCLATSECKVHVNNLDSAYKIILKMRLCAIRASKVCHNHSI